MNKVEKEEARIARDREALEEKLKKDKEDFIKEI